MSLFNRNTPYSNLYVSTPFEKRGNLNNAINFSLVRHRSKNWAHILGPTMAEIPSRIRLRLPTYVMGYTKLLPRYAAMNCTRCAAYPSAVATVSSFMSLCAGKARGGAGSVDAKGMGKGTSTMVYSRSGGERSSIGYIVAKVDNTVVRVAAIRLVSEPRRALR